MTKTYILERDGKVLKFASNENELYKYLHRIQPASWEHALKYEGYSIMALQGLEMDNDTITTLNDILNNGLYREKVIVEDFGSIEVPKTPYGDNVINVYNKAGDGFQVFVRTVNGHRKGDITG